MGWDMERARAVVLVELCDDEGERVAVAGQPVEDRLVRVAQDAMSSQPIVWALRSGSRCSSSRGRRSGGSRATCTPRCCAPGSPRA